MFINISFGLKMYELRKSFQLLFQNTDDFSGYNVNFRARPVMLIMYMHM